jgi:cytochrome c-type biogenesis protein CcmF
MMPGLRPATGLAALLLLLVLPGLAFAGGAKHYSASELLEDLDGDSRPDKEGRPVLLVGPTARATVIQQLKGIEEALQEARANGAPDEVERLEHIRSKNQEFLPRLIKDGAGGELCFPVTEVATGKAPPKSVMVCSKSIRRVQVEALDDGTVAIVQGYLKPNLTAGGRRTFSGDELLAPHRANLGRFLILLALALAAAGACLGYVSGRSYSERGARMTRQVALAFCAALGGANLLMIESLLRRDISVSYVDQVGSHLVPNWVAVVSLWSSLEGSILFWGLIFSAFTSVFVLTTAQRPEHRPFATYTVATILTVGMFFCFLIAGPADPFGPSAWPHQTGASHVGPNPLLQNHLLMIIHPPMLYLGYVGMVIPFSMGVAALLRGQLGAGWMRPIRLWMLVPWGFLTVGIVLGGWWAYEVLGWGGYWAWDPVENASLLPWLTASAFLHAAMLMERRGTLKSWTMVLLFSTFALTILGTFMTRSGVFNSVHAFAKGAIGPAFLVFLGIVLLASVLLLGLRTHLLEAEGEFQSLLSRDAVFVGNNLLFVSFTLTVLIGTTFPLIKEALLDEKVSVGEPYFNSMVVPIAVAIVFLMGVGPALPWGRATPGEAARRLRTPLIAGILLAGVGIGLGARDFWPALTLFVSGFAAMVSFREMAEPVVALQRRHSLPLGAACARAFRRGRRRYGGHVVHIGVALMAVSIAVSSAYQVQSEAVINRGESMTVGDYKLTFEGVDHRNEPHRQVVAASIRVSHKGVPLGHLEPAMIRYPTQTVGTPAVLSRIGEDLYLSAMQIDDKGSYVGIRAYINPMVYWVWIAAGVMVLGCLISLWPAPKKAALLPEDEV